MECIFCQIVSGDISVEAVYRDDLMMVFPDQEPAAKVHLLAVPARHVASLEDLTEADLPLLAGVRRVAAEQLPAGYRISVNTGEHQGVPHLHFHILGGGPLGQVAEKEVIS